MEIGLQLNASPELMSRVLGQIRALGHSCTGNCICTDDKRDSNCTAVGHSGWVKAAAFSPDGTRIVSGADDSVVMIWHVETGALVSPRRALRGGISKVNFHKVYPLLTIFPHKTNKRLQERTRDTPTKGLLWTRSIVLPRVICGREVHR